MKATSMNVSLPSQNFFKMLATTHFYLASGTWALLENDPHGLEGSIVPSLIYLAVQTISDGNLN